VREVVSGLQFGDEQDRGSRAQPDIAGISTRDAERMLSAGEEQNYKALSRTLREGKGVTVLEIQVNAVIREISSLLYKLSRLRYI